MALNGLFEGIAFTCFIPEVCNHTYSEIRRKKQVKNSKIDTYRYARIPVAQVILQRSSAHCTLGERFTAQQQ
jgi:hypothetical protein